MAREVRLWEWLRDGLRGTDGLHMRRVENLVSEVEYSITDDCEFVRKVNLPSARVYDVAAWKEQKRGYYETLSSSQRNEMQDIYHAAAGEVGEDAYLSDGVWIRPDGSLDDRGR